MNDFAGRVSALEPEGAYAVLARAQALEAQGRQVLHLEIGQPDFPTFEHISRSAMAAIAEGKTRYTQPAGIPTLRQAIAEDVSRRRGISVHPAQVVIGPGAKPGLFFSTLALVEPGDEVIYPDPGFPTYEAMIRVAGGTPVPVPLMETNQFSYDLSVFTERLSPRTKLVILNSPANPTGGVMPMADLETIAAAAIENDFWVLSDEIYSRMSYSGSVPSIISFPHMPQRTILVDGFSKTYAMTGWRLGYAVMPEALAQRVELLLTHSVGCTATFTQVAGVEAILGDQSQVDAVVEDYRQRRDRMVAGLNTIPGVSCQLPEGAFYAFPNVKSIGLSSKDIAARLLDEQGVALLAGSDFGPGGEGYLRLCYATSADIIDRALEKMETFFKSARHL